jgi:hypothetical protein
VIFLRLYSVEWYDYLESACCVVLSVSYQLDMLILEGGDFLEG